MGLCCSDNQKDPWVEDFLKEQEAVNQRYTSLVKPQLVASMSKIYITQRNRISIIPEEEGNFESSTIPNSYLRFTIDANSKRSDDLSFNFDSQLIGSIVQFNYIFGSKLLLKNWHTNFYLHSHCLKSKKNKQANQVNLKNELSNQVYLEWILLRDQGGSIQNGDRIQIEHVVTKKKLCLIENPISKLQEVCCNDSNDDWRIEVFNKDGILRIGSFMRIYHQQSNQMLVHTRKRILMKEHNFVTASSLGKCCIWQVLLSEQ